MWNKVTLHPEDDKELNDIITKKIEMIDSDSENINSEIAKALH